MASSNPFLSSARPACERAPTVMVARAAALDPSATRSAPSRSGGRSSIRMVVVDDTSAIIPEAIRSAPANIESAIYRGKESEARSLQKKIETNEEKIVKLGRGILELSHKRWERDEKFVEDKAKLKAKLDATLEKETAKHRKKIAALEKKRNKLQADIFKLEQRTTRTVKQQQTLIAKEHKLEEIENQLDEADNAMFSSVTALRNHLTNKYEDDSRKLAEKLHQQNAKTPAQINTKKENKRKIEKTNENHRRKLARIEAWLEEHHLPPQVE